MGRHFRICIFTFLVSAPCLRAAATQYFNPYMGPKPIAVLIDRDVWLDAIGSDMPRMVVYENGLVIGLQKQKDGRLQYVCRNLSVVQVDSVTEVLDSLTRDSVLNGQYFHLTNWTDQNTAEIHIYSKSRPFSVRAYGLSVGLGCTSPDSIDGAGARDSLPQGVLRLYLFLAGLSLDSAQPWTPEYIEAMVWPYTYAPDRSIVWPREFPDLNSTSTRRWADTDSALSIFMPGEKLDQLRSFLMKRKQKGAVEIDGRKWMVTFRLVFPSEFLWNNVPQE